MKVLKKNQLAILVIALMLVTAGYLNYTAGSGTVSTGANVVKQEEYAAIGDATLVNSGELIEEKDKQEIINTINSSQIAEKDTETKTNENQIRNINSIQHTTR